MRYVELVFEERRQPWSFAVEPWAQVYEVPAHRPVVFRIPCVDAEEEAHVGVSYSAEGVTVGVRVEEFSVRVGDELFEYP